MLCHITWLECGVGFMPVGNSGRIVVELDPDFKVRLHAALKSEGSNLKEWFVARAEEYLVKADKQTELFPDTSPEESRKG